MSTENIIRNNFKEEMAEKLDFKFDKKNAAQCLEWVKRLVEGTFSTDGNMENFHAVLKDGVVLCQLINVFEANSIKKIVHSRFPFKCLENIAEFLQHVRRLGVPTEDTFQSIDLWEGRNLFGVLVCLQSLGRLAEKYGQPTLATTSTFDDDIEAFDMRYINAPQFE